ncbi:redoxin domain-containing protein [Kaistella sp. BT6-1-3]|uniref:Redoxin domain-containing protein n=1 Tax=Kaistella yananensis TaxID=2989820 RepID=A0ABT3JQV5_9FLAO|nr:redoxin domain-containing protein [Kaistella yananensis]MCW4453166.1 redoxin domain-containing protein [Kaistella yananensis]
MNKLLISLILLLNFSFLFAKNDLEKTREKFNKNKSVSYVLTAFYPNPDTDEVTTLKTFYIINNYNSSNFDFYSKRDNTEEIWKNGNYTEINNSEKTFSQFEFKKNQANAIKNSRLVQYGPTFLLKNNWKYENDILINGVNYSRYSFIESVRKYEEKTIKVEFNIFISPKNLISKLERKSYVDDKLGQRVTFDYSDYKFSKKEINFNSPPQEKYALKYFERSNVNPLKVSTKAPSFVIQDIENNEISDKNFIDKNTLLLFSGTNCGASIEISNFINNENFKLSNNLHLINFYATDSKDIVNKFFKNRKSNFPIIADQAEIEKKYQVSGYPVLYLVDEKGIITKSLQGLEPIMEYLKSEKSE